MHVIQQYHQQIDRIRRQQMELRNRGCKALSIDWPYGSNPCSMCQQSSFLSMVHLSHRVYPLCLDCGLRQASGHLRGATVVMRPKQSLFEGLATKLWRHSLRTHHIQQNPTHSSLVPLDVFRQLDGCLGNEMHMQF